MILNKFNYTASTLALAIITFFIACKDDVLKEIGTNVSLNQTEFKLPVGEGTNTINVSADGPWRAKLLSEETDWITLHDNIDKKGNGSFSFSYTSNEGGIPRLAYIVVNAGYVSDTIRVEQAGENIILETSIDHYKDDVGSGGLVTIPVQTNIPVGILRIIPSYMSETNIGWITDIKLEDGNLNFKLLANTAEEGVRLGTINLLYIDPFEVLHSILINLEQEEVTAGAWFVKVGGTGSGYSWDDALSAERFINEFDNLFASGDIVYIAGGVYHVSETSSEQLNVKKGVTLIGGFDPNSTGKNTDIDYPSTYETILSGDANRNNVADNGDSRVVNVTTQEKVTFRGITFRHAHVTSAAVSTSTGSNVDMYYCTIKDNIATGDNSGAGLYVYNGSKVYCYKTIFTNNQGYRRGGAVLLAGGAIILESCLIANNILTDRFGAAIQLSASSGYLSELYAINTSIVDNKSVSYGAGISISSGQKAYFISSTIARNECSTTTPENVEGHNLRIESNDVHIVNSIVTSTSTTGTDINISGSNTLKTYGGNIVGTKGGTGSFTPHPSDISGKKPIDIFGSNNLSDNGGFPKTIALTSDLVTTPIGNIQSVLSSLNLGRAIDIAVDQRGVNRSSNAASSGAYER